MVTADDVKLWTGIDLSGLPPEQFQSYLDAAEQQIKADGADNLAEPKRTQAISYLIASYTDSANSESQYESESIGGYSYKKKSSVSGLSYWEDKYRSLLPSVTIGASRGSGCVRRTDDCLVRLGGPSLKKCGRGGR